MTQFLLFKNKGLEKVLTVLIMFFIFSLSHAQTILKPVINRNPDIENAAKKTEILSADRIDIQVLKRVSDTTLFPILLPIKPKRKEEYHFIDNFKMIKDSLPLIYEKPIQSPKSTNSISINIPPIKLGYGFDTNEGDIHAPLDNTMAVSDDDFKVIMTNGIVEYYDKTDLVFSADLSSFIDHTIPDPGDPKVIFDPVEKRFIFCLQRSDGSFNKSEIMVAFSKSSNPLDGWNFYKVSGNPLKKDNHWFDYPKIGISNNSLFISGNTYHGKSFSQAIVYHFDKSLGFSGDILKYRVWYDFVYEPFTIEPVSYAFDNSYGDGIYMLSTAWGRRGRPSNYIKLFDITSNIYDNDVSVRYFSVETTPYSFFGYAVQINTKIDNGDIRMQDALLYDNKIYYTFTSGNANNFSRINYNVLDLPSLTNKSKLLGDLSNYSYAYPSLNFLSKENTKPNVLIQYNGTSNESYPDIRVINCDENLNCSQEIVIKTGESTIIDYNSRGDYSKVTRWGDYSEVVRNYTRDNELFIISSYGKNQGRQSFLGKIVPFDYKTTIWHPFSRIENRLYAKVNLNFSLKSKKDIEIILNDGNKPRIIYDGTAGKGINLFQIYTDELHKGNYTLEVLKKNSSKALERVSFAIEQ